MMDPQLVTKSAGALADKYRLSLVLALSQQDDTPGARRIIMVIFTAFLVFRRYITYTDSFNTITL